MRGYTAKQFSELLVKHGWVLSHRKSSHITYEKQGVSHHVTVPDSRNEICRPLARRLMKEAGIAI